MSRLLVTGLSYLTTKEHFLTYFAKFGSIKEYKIAVENDSGFCRGYGFIEFVDTEASDACHSQPKHNICNRTVSVDIAQNSIERAGLCDTPSRQLVMSFLGISGVSDDFIRRAFKECGEIISVEFNKDELFRPLGTCTVTFSTEAAVELCLQKKWIINGMEAVVRKCIRKEDLKIAEQQERERLHAEEMSKHGYAGFSALKRKIEEPVFYSSMSSLLGPSKSILNDECSRSDDVTKRMKSYGYSN